MMCVIPEVETPTRRVSHFNTAITNILIRLSALLVWAVYSFSQQSIGSSVIEALVSIEMAVWFDSRV